MASIIDDLRSRWTSMSDEEKQSTLDMLGEMIGGTAGALAGGPTPMAIPGAGAGAVAGQSAAHFVGKAMGIKPTPKSAGETARDVATTFVSNAAGEGVGRAIPVAYRGVKSLAGRAARWAVNPDPTVLAAAAKAGVELTPGMASQRPIVKMSESALEKLPGATDAIRGKTVKAVEQWDGSARKIPQKFRQTPVSTTEAGTAAAEQLADNRAAASANFSPQYRAMNQKAGAAPIDFAVARDDARTFLDGLPQGMESYFPSSTIKKLKTIAGMPDGQKLPGNAMIDGPVPVMTFEEAQQLRTGLLEAERAMSHGDAAVQRRAIPALRKSVDSAIEDSLANSSNPAHQQALQDWRTLNKSYADTSSKLYAGGKRGNPITQNIDAAKQPELIPPALTRTPTSVSQAETALTPIFGAQDRGAMDALRRNAADDLIEGSRTQNRFVGDERYVNPRKLEKSLDEGSDTYQALFGAGPYQELRESAKLGKAVTSPSQLTNTSDTARYNNLIRYGTAPTAGLVGVALTGGDATDKAVGAVEGLAAGIVVPRLAARAWTGPVTRAMTGAAPKPLSPLTRNLIQPILGASGRAIAEMQKLPPRLNRPGGSDGDEFFEQGRKSGDEFFAQ